MSFYLSKLIMPPSFYMLGVFFIIALVGLLPKLFTLKFVRLIDLPKINLVWFIAFCLALIVLISFLDNAFSKYVLTLHTVNNMIVFNFISACAEGWLIVAVLGVLLILSLVYDKKHLLYKTKISLYSLIYLGVINSILKALINRTRPATALDSHQFFNYIFNSDFNLSSILYSANSMPSGHTVTIVGALFPFIYFAPKVYVKVFLSAICVVVMLARVWTLNHWLSDVFVATAIAYYISYALIIRNEEVSN